MRVCAQRFTSLKIYHKPRHYYHAIHYTVPLYYVHHSSRYMLRYQYKITLSALPIPTHHYSPAIPASHYHHPFPARALPLLRQAQDRFIPCRYSFPPTWNVLCPYPVACPAPLPYPIAGMVPRSCCVLPWARHGAGRDGRTGRVVALSVLAITFH
jgi:hypothetical protein